MKTIATALLLVLVLALVAGCTQPATDTPPANNSDDTPPVGAASGLTQDDLTELDQGLDELDSGLQDLES